MAYVSSGPVSTLPGARLSLPLGAECDRHEGRPAVARIQGETDSMGCEAIDMCQECLDAYQNRDKTEEQTGCCDRCRQHKTTLAPRRDYDEGSCGPIYKVCLECCIEENERAAEELAEYDYRDWDLCL